MEAAASACAQTQGTEPVQVAVQREVQEAKDTGHRASVKGQA